MACSMHPSDHFIILLTLVFACGKKDGYPFYGWDWCISRLPFKACLVAIQHRNARLQIPFAKDRSRSDVFWQEGLRPMARPDKERPAASLRRFSTECSKNILSLACQLSHGLRTALSTFLMSKICCCCCCSSSR